MSGVEVMTAMFSGCSSLTSLDLSNFYTNKKPHMDSMFKNCINLEYINLKKLRFPDMYDCPSNDNMFENVKKNIVINLIYRTCIEIELKDLKCSKIDTTSDWK